MARKTHREFSKQEVTLEAVSRLLSLVWGVRGYIHSPGFGKLVHKTSPSAGARHPGEVYLMALRVEGLKPGLYHYHPAYHRLEMISTNATREKAWRYCARQNFAKNAAALFLMTAVFRRTMWKYHLPRAYRVVLLDAGHLCPNVLSRRDLAWSRAVLHGRAEGYTDRKGPRHRWNSRVGALRSRSRSSCYFGASEATIFSKRGSPRNESQ